MSRESFALIRNLSSRTQSPARVERVMHNYFKSNIKLTNRNLTVNLLKKLQRSNIGTNEVMEYTKKIESQFYRKPTGMSRNVHFVMREKIFDAEWAEKQIRKQFLWNKSEYHETIPKNSEIDVVFNGMMRNFVGNIWNLGKEKNSEKVM